MKKRTPAIIPVLLAALLTTAALMALVRLPYLTGSTPKTVSVREQNGVYDLTGLGDLNGVTAVLPPGPNYYPNTYLLPEKAGAAEPESTDRYDAIRAGCLSQRFVLELPDNSGVYALTFRLSGRHALRVYVNGREAGQTGSPGVTAQDTEVWENNITCYAAPSGGKLEIILHSAQFHHYKRGASLAELSVRKATPALHSALSSETKGFLVMGALLCAALFLFCLFLLRPGTKATFYFALACLAMVLREGLQSQAWTYFSWIPGNLSFMLEYLSVVLLTVFLTLYLVQDLTGRFWRILKYTMLAGSGIYAACLFFTGPLFYTALLPYYQALLIAGIALGVGGLFWRRRRPSVEQAAALYGIAVFYLAAVSDILMYSDIFWNVQRNVPVSEAAMLVFVLAQTVSLFLMKNRLNAGGALNIAGGTVSPGRGRGDNVGIYNFKALISGGTAYGSLRLSNMGALIPENGGRIYLLAQSQVEGMGGRLVDRGEPMLENGVVTVGPGSQSPSATALSEGYYTGDGALFHRQLITIQTRPPEEVTVTQGQIAATLSVAASAGPSPVQYQWQQWSESANRYESIAGATAGDFAIPAGLTATGGYQGSGVYYFACEVTAEGYERALIEVMVTVAPPAPARAYTVTFDAGGGSVSPASAQTGTDGRLPSGLPVPLRSGYSFAGWFTARTGGTQMAPDRIYIADTTIYAQWNGNGGSGDDDDGGGGSGSVNPNPPGYIPDSAITTAPETVKVELSGDATKVSAAQIKSLSEANREKAVTIQGKDYSITFPRGTLAEGAEQAYDFGLRFDTGANLSALRGLAGDSITLMASFNHSGPLPAEALITFEVGAEHAGKTLHYYYYNEQTGSLEYLQSATVAADGTVTVRQSHCSDYILSDRLLSGEHIGGQPRRVSGADLYQTAVAVSKAYFTRGADTVVIARGDNPIDALPSVPLARYYSAPLLLTAPDRLPPNVLAEIRTLGAKKAILVGGSLAVSQEIAARLPAGDGRAVLVNGDRAESTFADALSISSWAGYHGVPILYADSAAEVLPAATAKALAERNTTDTLLIGGPLVLPKSLEALLPNPARYGGADCYATNVEVLRALQPEAEDVFAATGRSYADALAGAAVAAQSNGWVLLTGGSPTGLTELQETLLRERQGKIKDLRVFGGPAAVPDATLEKLRELLGL